MHTILLVEESHTQATRLQGVLERQGWEVLSTSNAADALEQIQRHRPDLILVGCPQPGPEAHELCRTVKEDVRTGGIPILALTAEDAISAVNPGVDDHVSKSADSDTLIRRIRTHLEKPHARPKSHFRQARLLAIDDSPTYLERLRVDLEQSDLLLETASSGQAGLEMVEGGRYDCILVDLIMPDVNGIEVCHRLNLLRQRDRNPVMILMLTAAESGAEMTRALDAGADDFVGKSSDRSVLQGRIRSLLRRKFLEEENRRIVAELKTREMEALQARAETAAAQVRAALVEELQRTAAELRLANEHAEKANRELERANQAKSEFLTTMSHELRTPLNAIIGFSEVMMSLDGLSSEECSEYATYIHEAGVHLLTMITDVLDLSRIESGRLILNLGCLVVASAITSAVSLIQPLAAKRQQHIVVSADSLGMMEADGPRLRQILVNLLSNAVKYTPERGHIELRASADEDLVRIHVSDQGIGINAADLERIFYPFEQVNPSPQEGTGLGLAITRRLVEAHGGILSVVSAPGQGSTFSIALPRRQSVGKPLLTHSWFL